jgi:hypothetical protein
MVVLGRRCAWLLVLGLLPACANATQRGHALYVDGRFIEAAEVFEHSESHLTEVDDRERVIYGLYRGATLLKLGDLDGASRWLYFARQAESHRPGSLESADAKALQLALKALDEGRNRVKPKVDPLKGALARATSSAQTHAADVAASGDSASAAVPPATQPVTPPSQATVP